MTASSATDDTLFMNECSTIYGRLWHCLFVSETPRSPPPNTCLPPRKKKGRVCDNNKKTPRVGCERAGAQQCICPKDRSHFCVLRRSCCAVRCPSHSVFVIRGSSHQLYVGHPCRVVDGIVAPFDPMYRRRPASFESTYWRRCRTGWMDAQVILHPPTSNSH